MFSIRVTPGTLTDLRPEFPSEGVSLVNMDVNERHFHPARLGFVLLCVAFASHRIAVAEDVISLRQGLSKINVTDLKRHVSTLASDAFEGREAGSRGGKAAMAYLRTELKALREKNRLPLEQTQEFGREYHNILLLLPGSDPELRREVIVIGAHYDHVGYGNASNSQGPIGNIHNGADDNASGVSALMELIEAYSSLEATPPRSILFAFWDGEEVGLLGSKHWVAHPTVPIQDLRFAMNIDMLGKLREGRVITVGWRSAPGLRAMLASHNVANELQLAFQPRVIADSDHYPFYAAGIPAIHLDTDKHYDYHRPSDDAEKLNWDGLLQMSQFAYRVTLEAASRADFPRFRRDAFGEIPPKWMSPTATLAPPLRMGVAWNAQRAQNNVVEISQLTPNSPAANAGLRVGDRIVRMGPWENGTFEDFKTALQIVKNPVTVRIQHPEMARRSTLRSHSPATRSGWVPDGLKTRRSPIVW